MVKDLLPVTVYQSQTVIGSNCESLFETNKLKFGLNSDHGLTMILYPQDTEWGEIIKMLFLQLLWKELHILKPRHAEEKGLWTWMNQCEKMWRSQFVSGSRFETGQRFPSSCLFWGKFRSWILVPRPALFANILFSLKTPTRWAWLLSQNFTKKTSFQGQL